MVLEKKRPDLYNRLANFKRVAAAWYLWLVKEPDHDLPPILNQSRTIDSFDDADCKVFFQFGKDDLRRLVKELQFQDSVVLERRYRMPGEEVLLRGLYELVDGGTQYKAARLVFGRDQSIQSRAFKYFINHIYDHFHHLVHDNLNWFRRNGLWEKSRQAIQARMLRRNPSMTERNNISHFIDCNCLPTSRCGGGPAERGANSARWHPLIQQAFYNGWKSIHGLKHQTVDNAFGITEDMFGPEPLRRHDTILYNDSNINDRFGAEQGAVVRDERCCIFGDSAYKTEEYVRSYYKTDYYADDPELQRKLVLWNRGAKHCRISIEWNYGVTGALFRYVINPTKLKVLKGEIVSRIYTVATLFRNFHVCMYGCNTSAYFGLEIPSDMFENYVNRNNF
jgi:hypothetical protein